MKNRYAMTDTQSELCASAEKYADAYDKLNKRFTDVPPEEIVYGRGGVCFQFAFIAGRFSQVCLTSLSAMPAGAVLLQTRVNLKAVTGASISQMDSSLPRSVTRTVVYAYVSLSFEKRNESLGSLLHFQNIFHLSSFLSVCVNTMTQGSL